MTSWVTEYIGKPYRLGEAGPDYFDCYGLVVTVLSEVYGVRLDASQVAGSAAERISREIALGEWKEKEEAEPGDPCVLWRGNAPAHIGVWTEYGILHATKSNGVVLSNSTKLRAGGWKWRTYTKAD